MKKLFITIFLMMLMGNAVFAGEGFIVKNEPLAEKQQRLFLLNEKDFESPIKIQDIEYDRDENQLYIILRMEAEGPHPSTQQYVYSLDSNQLVDTPTYVVADEYNRLRIQFDDHGAWSLEKELDGESIWLTRTTADQEVIRVSVGEIKNFAVYGDQIILQPTGCSEVEGFEKGNIDPITLELSQMELIEPAGINDEKVSVNQSEFAFSADGQKLIYAEQFGGSEGVWINTIYWEESDLDGAELIRKENRFEITASKEDWECAIFDLYTTEDYIVVFSKALMMENGIPVGKGFIERYTYGGELVDSVITNFGVRRITEGQNGSTIYIQKHYEDDIEQDMCSGGTMEVIQVNWENGAIKSRPGGLRHIIQEQTRTGLTIARFQDNQFGLLRAEDPETGVLDYRAPIRSEENLVRLQMSYCDVVAKMASGARNLVVEYKDQMIELPMAIFDCDDLLTSMPCQDEATFEVILKADEAGNVSYQVQLFVVEEVNGMTKLVHRKTIQ